MMSKIYDKYLELKSIDSSKMYLFKSGKFYIFIADDCDKINDYLVLKKVKFTNEVYKCGFPENVLNDYIRVFNNHNLKFEIVDDYNLIKSNSIEDYIMNIDLNKLSPIDALMTLNDIQKRIKNGKSS